MVRGDKEAAGRLAPPPLRAADGRGGSGGADMQRVLFQRSLRYAARCLVCRIFFAAMRQSVVAFGLALVALSWLGAQALIYQQRKSLQDDIISDARNLSVTLDREVIHTINDLDRILLFLRWSHDHSVQLDWPSVVTERYTVDSETVQIAVIDRKGMMLASSVMPHPTSPVDLSDREHFLAQRNAAGDALFISKPMVGRASGKPSVQFSRRLTDAAGAFAA